MIAKNGKAMITILTAANPTPQEQYAAAELRHYLNLMTGASFTVAAEGSQAAAKAANENVVAIGAAANAVCNAGACDLGEDAFTVKNAGKNGGSIAITGGKRGVIYGVYELLETLGCRFFTPLCEHIPCKPELPLPVINTTQKPILEYRTHNYKDFDQFPRFAVKNRINGGHIPEDIGGSVEYAWFVHTFGSQIITPDEYWDEHPEYFSLVEGKRIREFTQLCLTNPDVLRITVEKVRAALLANPECRIISVSPNDWYNFCTCPACAEIDAREESHAGSLIWFVNQIAEKIEKDFPDAIIDTLAYQYSRQAPKHIRPRHNVCVRLCSIESCFSHSFEKCDDASRKTMRPDGIKTSFIEDLRDWAKVCDRLYIWDYTTCFAHYPAPHPNWNTLQPNMKSFIANNVKGVFEQACGAAGGGVDLNELRAYLVGKLLWDANCDLERHKREFCDYFYGAAAPYILEYMKTLVDKVEKDNIHVGFNDQCDAAFLTDEMLDIYDGIFTKAERAVAGDPVRAARVAKVRLSVRWVRMKNKQMAKNITVPEEINSFFTDWRAHGLTRVDEWVSAETTLRAMLEGHWRGVEFYTHWTDEGPERL